ncbi:phosphonate C-P lyase system protein PhnH [Acetobacteraceae bacterium H6797]|nr:phosphonate C-P lyase system protein PhnH [Acetobacteraceae bacterium H6797]
MSLTPGFADPVLGAQSCFRALLTAMSRPGLVQTIGGLADPPPGLDIATAGAALTLLDAETPLHHDAGAAANEWLAFHAGCPMAETPAEAAFVIATGEAPSLAVLNAGTDEIPESGATIIIQVKSLTEGSGWRLTGPGIEREHRLAVEGLPAGFAADRAKLARHFPRGVDVVLCAGDKLAAIPRTTRIEETR